MRQATLNHVMATIREVAEALGLSERAVRLRVDALDGVLDAHVRRGPNNRLEFTEEAIAILRALEELRQTEGIPLRQAASKIREKLRADGKALLRKADVKLPGQATSNPVQAAHDQRKTVEVKRLEVLLWAIVVLLGLVAVELALIVTALWLK